MATSVFPDGFLWGIATAAHQIEGGNWNNDWWACEHAPGTTCDEVSGDACDRFRRYRRRHRAAARPRLRRVPVLARVVADRTRRRRVLASPRSTTTGACIADLPRARRAPVVTFHHFTHATLGGRGAAGWARARRSSTGSPASASGRLRTSATSSRWRCTINEPNIVSLHGLAHGHVPARRCSDFDAVRARRTSTWRRRTTAPYDALKAGPGDFPVGLTLSMSDWWTPEGGDEEHSSARRPITRTVYLEAARGDDFVGVQAYSRTRIGLDGAADRTPSRASRSSSRWATSTGRSRSRPRSGTRSR